MKPARQPGIISLAFALLMIGALTSTGASQSVETLLAYLKSPNEKTRRDAARELGKRRVRDQVVVESLIVAATRDDDSRVRQEALAALGLIKDQSATPAMIEALGDPESDVRLSAVTSLVALYTEHNIDFITNRRIGWNRLNPFLDTNDNEIIEHYTVVEPSILMALGETARADGDRGVRIAAIRSLGVLRGSVVIPHLADALTADQDVRVDVIRTFIKIGEPAAGHHLVQFFRDSNSTVRTQSMFAVGMLKYLPAVEPLMSVYGLGPESTGTVTGVSRKVRGLFQYLPPRDEAALWALSLIGDVQAEHLFVENIDHRSSMRRQYAFEGLARIADERYLDQISRLNLTERDQGVRLSQHFAMYKMGARANLGPIVNALDGDGSEQMREYLLEVDDPAHLYPYVRSSNRRIARHVIEVLGRIGDRSTIKELEPVARSSGPATTDAATLAIKRIEWRISGRPTAADEVLKRETRPRKSTTN